MAKIFMTGGTGCIGASTVFNLLQNYGDQIEQILIATRGNHTEQLKIWFGETLQEQLDLQRIKLVSVDLGDTPALQQTLKDFQPTRVIHLGALQSPACDADPEKGVDVNLTGTMKLFHVLAESEASLDRLVFASSGAVYGKRSMYDTETVPENVQLAPPNLYGVWKVAGENLAALFHEKTGVPTVSLRLNTTYGPGRDQGTTSAVTRIMKSLAAGANRGSAIACQMPYQGRENYHYVEDVGAHFAGVTMLPFSGCQSFNIKGKTIEVAEFLEIVKRVGTEMGIGKFLDTGITPGARPNLFICDLDDRKIGTRFPGLPRTELAEGVRKTLNIFLQQSQSGTLKMPS